MRLFYAITLPEPVKESLTGFSTRLSDLSEKGRFTDPGNLHLTLVFLGEVPAERLEPACAVMRSVHCAPFTLSFAGLGCFPRGSRGIWWVGVDPSEPLSQLQHDLAVAVRKAGFALEDQTYRPHLTLGREVLPKPGTDFRSLAGKLPPLSISVETISLMESCRVDGRLLYRPLHVHWLDT